MSYKEARKEREDALDLLEYTRVEYIEEARAVAKYLAKHRSITINDVRERCPVPEGINPVVLGAVFRGDIWVKVGYQMSDRKVSHGRPIAQWILNTHRRSV